MKDRTDLEIITFNVDEDLGLVQPFMKERATTSRCWLPTTLWRL